MARCVPVPCRDILITAFDKASKIGPEDNKAQAAGDICLLAAAAKPL